mgnify:CR=1 FL=1
MKLPIFQIDAFTRRLSVRVYRYLERRVERAYPAVQPVPEKKEKTENSVKKTSPEDFPSPASRLYSTDSRRESEKTLLPVF